MASSSEDDEWRADESTTGDEESVDSKDSGSTNPKQINVEPQITTVYTDDRIKADAQAWALTFQPPELVNVPPKTGVDGQKPVNRRVKQQLKQPKRAKVPCNPDYCHLLNVDIRDAVSHQLRIGADPTLPPSQIGISSWTTIEKGAFFTALGRLGKDNTRAVASRIGTKSEMEVRQYMQLLQQGYVNKVKNESKRQLLDLSDLPAAVQVSSKCEELMESAGEAISLLQARQEEKIEKSKWGDSWLLTDDTSTWLKKQRKGSIENNAQNNIGNGPTSVAMEDTEAQVESSQIVGQSSEKQAPPKTSEIQGPPKLMAAAELLKLENWLKLSKRIFMNSGKDPEEANWQCLVEPGEEVGIRATAFEDFHTLATIMVRRLVSAAFICAKSRLGSRKSKRPKRKRLVRRSDVYAAARSMNLDRNSREFWVACPRRNHLEMYNDIAESLQGVTPLDYGRVEKSLRSRKKLTEIGRRPSSEEGKRESSKTLEKDVTDDGINEQGEKDPEEITGLTYPYLSDDEHPYPELQTKQELKRARAEREVELAQDQYAEAIDTRASLTEERKLWELLKQNPPAEIKRAGPRIGKRPREEKKRYQVEDWRDRTVFKETWETMAVPVPEKAFANITKRKRKSSV